MPFKSKKQDAWAHTKEGMAKLGPKTLDQFDKASEGLKLPVFKDPMPSPFTPGQKSNWRK